MLTATQAIQSWFSNKVLKRQKDDETVEDRLVKINNWTARRLFGTYHDTEVKERAAKLALTRPREENWTDDKAAFAAYQPALKELWEELDDEEKEKYQTEAAEANTVGLPDEKRRE